MKDSMKKIILVLSVLVIMLTSYFIYTDINKDDKLKPNEPVVEEKPSENQPTIEEQINDRIKQTLSEMSLEEKVGQMFIVRHPLNNALSIIDEYHLGGYIMYARDFKDISKTNVTNNIKKYQEASKIPLFMAVDEEGGSVNRVSLYYRDTPFKSSQELYKEGGFDLIKNDTIEKSNLLKEIGLNVNFAPVADISNNPKDYIYKRTFGSNAINTSEYIKTVVEAMKEQKIGSVLKHFPGYGSSNDTHMGMAYDKRDYSEFVNNDFIPFKTGIESGADMVLVSHNIVSSMDEKYPASLSPKIHEILRDDLNFKGVIVTDALDMGAITQFGDMGEVAVLAVLAGNDLICCTDYQIQIKAVIDAVNNDRIDLKQIDESVTRILKLKIELGLL